MTFGLNILSSSGDIAFSTENRSYSFSTRLTIFSTTIGATQVYRTTISSTFGMPLLFYVPTSPGIGYSGANITSVSGSDYTFSIYTSDTQTPSITPLQVYVFLPQSTTATGYGLNVYDNSGNVTFSTGTRTLKIQAYYITQTSNVYPTPPSLSLTFGSIPSQYAICSASFGGQAQAISPGIGTRLWMMGARITTGGVMEFGRVLIAGGVSNPLFNYTFMVGRQYVPIIDKSLYD